MLFIARLKKKISFHRVIRNEKTITKVIVKRMPKEEQQRWGTPTRGYGCQAPCISNR